MNRSLKSILGALLLFANLPTVLAQQNDWPRTLPVEAGEVTIYSLQIHEMNEDIIHYRAALAYRSSPGAEPVFGAGWFESRAEVDQVNKTVHPRGLKITQTRFPEGTVDVQPALAKALAERSHGWNLDFPLDELQTAMSTAEAEAESILSQNSRPPRIIYRDHPALLVTIDGEPVLRDIENSPYEAVINTPYPLITDGRSYYLNAARDVWYRAGQATGPYQLDSNPPADIAAMVNDEVADTGDGSTEIKITAANAPEIIVSTEPAELVVTEGPAAFVPLVDDLLVLQNSDDDVFMHVSAQQYYIVLAGRWYHARTLNGPWTYQAADQLPQAFARIPQDSNQADSRVYVAGTEEAHEAVLDAYVPQTAAVARGEVNIDVEYDGEPNFEAVDGADLEYADNTGSTVLYSDRLYYLVEDGVWYVSTQANGPWQVSDYRPQQVDRILPSSPVYNVKYVYVYDSTPEVVYVGYTPGYIGSYVYHNTIIYGTGWYYRPWVSPRYYYPRHSTWGFNVHYDPWYGWNYGLSWGWGPFSLGFYPGGYWHESHYWHHRYYGHWGPRGYRHRAARYDRHRNDRHRYNRHRYGYNNRGRNRHRDNDRGHDGYNYDGRNRYRDHDHDGYRRNRNLYLDDAQRARIADTRARPYRSRSGRGDADRQVNNTRRQRSQEQRYIDGKKIGGETTGPVRPADLAVKAKLRDASSRHRQPKSIADTGRNVYRDSGRNASSGLRQRRALADTGTSSYRGSDRSTQQRDVSGRSNKPKKGERNRIMPVPRTGNELLASRNANPATVISSPNRPVRVNKENLRKTTAPELRERNSSKRKHGRSVGYERQRATAAPRQGQARASESATRQRATRSLRQQPVRTSANSAQRRVVASSQPRSVRVSQHRNRQTAAAPIRIASSRAVVNTSRQQKSGPVAAPARQPQPTVNSRQQRTARAAPAPAQQQRSPRKANKQQGSPQKAKGQQNRSVHQGGRQRGRGRN
jgi:hypothetical protein